MKTKVVSRYKKYKITYQKYYSEHKESFKQWAREYREQHRKRIREIQKKYRDSHKEQIRQERFEYDELLSYMDVDDIEVEVSAIVAVK